MTVTGVISAVLLVAGLVVVVRVGLSASGLAAIVVAVILIAANPLVGQAVGRAIAMLLLGVTGGVAPYFFDISQHTKAVDPVVQVLALTDVVVEAAVTALLLSFAIRARKKFGTLNPHELAEFKG
jgi:multisubunit Na+/H+ antiporter MnhC subunit